MTLLDDFIFETYDRPNSFQYTSPEGRIFTFQDEKLVSVRDPNGNTLTIGQNGIIHSSGKSVSFCQLHL